jgi:hypothetical protein
VFLFGIVGSSHGPSLLAGIGALPWLPLLVFLEVLGFGVNDYINLVVIPFVCCLLLAFAIYKIANR